MKTSDCSIIDEWNGWPTQSLYARYKLTVSRFSGQFKIKARPISSLLVLHCCWLHHCQFSIVVDCVVVAFLIVSENQQWWSRSFYFELSTTDYMILKHWLTMYLFDSYASHFMHIKCQVVLYTELELSLPPHEATWASPVSLRKARLIMVFAVTKLV